MCKELYSERELQIEKDMGSTTRYIKMLENNNKILQNRFKKVMEFVELHQKLNKESKK